MKKVEKKKDTTRRRVCYMIGILLLGIVAMAGFVATLQMGEDDFYNRTKEEVRSDYYGGITREYASEVLDSYLTAEEWESPEDWVSNTNFHFVIYEGKKKLCSDVTNVDAEKNGDWIRFSYEDLYLEDTTESDYDYDIYGGPANELVAQDKYKNVEYVMCLYDMRFLLLPLAFFCLIAAFVLFCKLMCFATKEEMFDRIWLEGIAGIGIVLFLIELLFIDMSSYSSVQEFIWFFIFSVIEYFYGMRCCISISIRIKQKALWKRTAISKLWSRAVWLICSIFSSTQVIWKVAVLVVFLAIDFIFSGVYFANYMEEVVVVEKIFIAIAGAYILVNLNRLQKGAKALAEGNLEQKVELAYLMPGCREHGEYLNAIQEGMQKAVGEKIKSERFKTELITNVSHDIKTPLTSIINYVDLLSKEELQNEKAEEYLEVLNRQSTKLKKLIEDLIEASKASTGNLKLDLLPCQADVLLTQTVGEYEEKLKANGLELQLKRPDEQVTILADGRYLWRVFDNLLSNISKYAQPQTRVYLNLEVTEKQVEIVFRNTSKAALNISAEELMERFVRGDASRHTEGSGLGLSIAKNLTEMMNGNFSLEIDGDLFKVTLRFAYS
ncbi:MAG: histidine kinase dimerization/phospho-acceptor domain-containing protein [Lachnospiraceae bacterium]